MFTGINSQIADLHQLVNAQRAILTGTPPEAILSSTGWFKGCEGYWRQEISDHLAEIKKPFPENGCPWGEIYTSVYGHRAKMGLLGLTVGDLLDHPQLYAAYPELAQTSLNAVPGRTCSLSEKSALNPRIIDIGQSVPMSEVKSVLMHELQHAIQGIEGFAKGGSVKDIKKADQERLADKDRFERALKQYETTHDPIAQENAAQEMQFYSKKMAATNQLLKNVSSFAEAYTRLAGEVEARNVQARLNLDDTQRQKIPPNVTADFAFEEQLIQGVTPGCPVPPHPLPNKGLHIGPIIDVTPAWITQDTGRGKLCCHPRDHFPSVPSLGTVVEIDTRKSPPQITEKSQVKTRRQSNER